MSENDSTQQKSKPDDAERSPEIPSAGSAAGEKSDGSAKTPQSESRDADSQKAMRPEGNAESQKTQSQPPSAADPKGSHAQQLSTDGKKEAPKVGIKSKRISAGAIVGIIMLLAVAFGVFAYMRRKKQAEQQTPAERSDEPLA